MSSHCCDSRGLCQIENYRSVKHELLNMEVKIFIPESKLLQQHIECFYILKHSKNDGAVNYLTYPSVNAVLSISNNATQFSEGIYISKHTGEDLLHSNLVYSFNTPIWLQYADDVDEITVYFSPLGINHFLEQPLSCYNNRLTDSFMPYNDYNDAIKSIMAKTADKERIDRLEEYLLTKYKNFHHPFLQQAVEMILRHSGDITLGEEALELGISRKTLHKHFLLHLGRTPSEFKNVARFRKALHKKVTPSSEIKLTKLAYYADYFDQAHMIKGFKAFTNTSPKKFFKGLTTNEQGFIYWSFR